MRHLLTVNQWSRRRRRTYDGVVDRVLGTSALECWIRRRPWVPDGILAACIAALVMPMTAQSVWDASWTVELRVVALGAFVVGHACIGLRRTAPIVAFGVMCGAMLVVVPLPDMNGAGGGAFAPILLPSVAVFPVILYSVAASCDNRTSRLGLAAGAVGILVVLARLWGADYLTVSHPGVASESDPLESAPLFILLGGLFGVVLPWGLGRHRRLRTKYVSALEERARREEQDRMESARIAAREERARIAREMHDVVAHSLSVMVSQAEGGRLMAKRDPSVTLPVLETIARTGQEAMGDMRCLLHAVHDDEPVGTPTPLPGLDELPRLIARVRGSGLPVTYAECGERLWVSGAGELAAYRVTQEALTNVLKHAGTDGRAHVCLEWQPGRLYVTVRNDPARLAARPVLGGRGLTGMSDRVTVLGGSLEAGPVGTGGFLVKAAIPTLAGVPG